jgi:hypothetical protein
MKKLIALIIFAAAFVITAHAVESDKPSTHDATWLNRHGKVSRADEGDCLSCHTDRIACIDCHEDTKPRDHTSAYVYKGHALKAKWSRETCAPCHTDSSFCDECHLIAAPSNHKRGWGGNTFNSTGSVSGRQGRHCTSGCHSLVASGIMIYGNDRVTRGCKTCHSRLERNAGGIHPPD